MVKVYAAKQLKCSLRLSRRRRRRLCSGGSKKDRFLIARRTGREKERFQLRNQSFNIQASNYKLERKETKGIGISFLCLTKRMSLFATRLMTSVESLESKTFPGKKDASK
jgi:hypothetical protein